MADKKEEIKYTKYEKARLLGSRALQISMGAPFLVKLEPKDMERIAYNPLEIAKLELEKGVLPMRVIRNLPRAGGLQDEGEEEAVAEEEEKPLTDIGPDESAAAE